MPPPFADAHVTREDLERLIAGPLGRAVELTRAAIDEAGLRPKQLTAIFLVGGSSRIPMISRLVHERMGVVPTTLDQPETVVARGALRAVLVDPDRTGALPGSSTARPTGAPTAGDQRTEVVRPYDASARPAPAFTPSRPPTPPSGATFSPLNASPRGGGQVAQAGQGRGLGPGTGGGLPPWQPQEPARAETSGKKEGRRKLPWLIGGALVVVAAVAAGLIITLGAGDDTSPGHNYAQYDYSFFAPDDWVQTGDNVADRQVIIRPDTAQTGNDLVVVQEYRMDYDSTANRPRLVTSLQNSVNNDPAYSGFDPNKQYAGKNVVYYHQLKDVANVDWYVVAQGQVRVHIGCQFAEKSLETRVRAACEQVVNTVKIVN
jgi:type VII secretion-associated protein (TIGR03931 family)